MIDFKYPQGAEQFDAAAFTQAGELIKTGHREECEQAAIEARGLYCWWIDGRPVIKTDFESLEMPYEVSANGRVFGTYMASSEQEARDLCAQDAGYADEAEMAKSLGQPSELVAVAQ